MAIKFEMESYKHLNEFKHIKVTIRSGDHKLNIVTIFVDIALALFGNHLYSNKLTQSNLI